MPVVDRIWEDYHDQVRFIAVAGRSTPEKTAAKAGEFFTNLEWGYDDGVWELLGIPGQPVTILITPDDLAIDSWFGALPEEEIRARLDALIAASS